MPAATSLYLPGIDETDAAVEILILPGRVERPAMPAMIAGQGVERLPADRLDSRCLVRGDRGGILGGGRLRRPTGSQGRAGARDQRAPRYYGASCRLPVRWKAQSGCPAATPSGSRRGGAPDSRSLPFVETQGGATAGQRRSSARPDEAPLHFGECRTLSRQRMSVNSTEGTDHGRSLVLTQRLPNPPTRPAQRAPRRGYPALRRQEPGCSARRCTSGGYSRAGFEIEVGKGGKGCEGCKGGKGVEGVELLSYWRTPTPPTTQTGPGPSSRLQERGLRSPFSPLREAGYPRSGWRWG